MIFRAHSLRTRTRGASNNKSQIKAHTTEVRRARGGLSDAQRTATLGTQTEWAHNLRPGGRKLVSHGGCEAVSRAWCAHLLLDAVNTRMQCTHVRVIIPETRIPRSPVLGTAPTEGVSRAIGQHADAGIKRSLGFRMGAGTEHTYIAL